MKKREEPSKNGQPENKENLMDRREVLKKAGLYALSTATMMVLMKSQPAKALSSPAPNDNTDPNSGTTWKRTTR